MGPRQSSEVKSKQKQFFENYQIIQEIPNQNIRFLQHKKTKKQYLLRQLSYTSKQQYLKAIQTIKNKRQQLKNSDHVIPLTQFFQKQEDQYCSTFYKLYVLYQYPQRTLDDQINQRNLRKNNFTETQLWSILASCILGLSHLQKKSIRHASLRSCMIFLSQQGLIKISDPFTTGYQTNYQTLLNKRNTRHIYLSPQQCQALQSQLISPTNINPYKSDIFTLGMIILQCGLLQYQDECYRDEYSRIHLETLQYNKNKFRKLYSQQLANMLNYMLGQDTNSRPEWIQLQNYVIIDTSKSFISQARKSNIFYQSKPVSVNLHLNNLHDASLNQFASQTGIPIQNGPDLRQNKVVSQKILDSKPTSNVQGLSNKGIGLSSLKPISVQNLANQQVQKVHPSQISSQHNLIVSEYPSSIIKNYSLQPVFANKIPVTQNNRNNNFVNLNFQPSIPVHLSNMSFNIPNVHNHIISPSYIRQSPIKNQSINKNLDITPANISNISATRPFRNIFPTPVYFTKTKLDQNLVQVEDDDNTSRTMSDLSQFNNLSSNQKQQAQANSLKKDTAFSNNITNHNSAFNSHQSDFLYSNSASGHLSYLPNPKDFKLTQNNVPLFQNITQSNGQFVIQTFKLGSRYEGNKLNGMRHGQGKFFYQDGGMYDGQWVKNKMEGYGKLYYQSGKIAYDGQWIQDQFMGFGILYNQNPDPLNQPFNYENFDHVEQFWTKYQGEFSQDSKNGKGTLYLSNGQYFQGNFLNDTAHGQGTYTTLSGKKIRGIWEMNLLEKQL